MAQDFIETVKNKLLKAENISPDTVGDCSCILEQDKLAKNKLYFETLTDDEFFDYTGAKKELVDFYKMIVKSRVGMIILGGINLGLGDKKVNNVARISLEESIISKYKEIVRIAHSANCKIILKVKSAFGRFNQVNYLSNKPKLASNFGINPANKQQFLIRASDTKCNEIVTDFAQSAMLGGIAGFDGLMIDATIDNLIGELSNDVYNKRIFGYYSDTKDLLTKMLKAVGSGNNFILLKLSIILPLEQKSKNAKRVNNFQNFMEKTLNLIKYYISLGVDGFEFIFGDNETRYLSEFNSFEGDNLFELFVTKVREWLNDNQIKNKFGEDVVIFHHDNFSNLSLASKLIENNIVNFIDVTRNLYSDTNYIKNLLNKKQGLNCINCSYCNQILHFNNKNQCLINPSFPCHEKLNNNGNGKLVAVVGSGISGLICALTLAERGFKVDIFEQKSTLNHFGKLTTIFGYDNLLLDYYCAIENRINEMVKSNKININLNQKFDLGTQDLNKYYSIIVATGFSKKFLSITGAVQSHVHSIYDFLENDKLLKNKNHIVIYAKSEFSLKLALWLAKCNKKITIIIKNTDWLNDNKNVNLFYFFRNLYNLQANIYFFARISKINEDNLDLIFNKNLDKNSMDSFLKIITNCKIKTEQRQINLDCDLLLYEPDITPNNSLYAAIVKKRYKGEVYLIGNALENSDLADIIKSGYFVGKNL